MQAAAKVSDEGCRNGCTTKAIHCYPRRPEFGDRNRFSCLEGKYFASQIYPQFKWVTFKNISTKLKIRKIGERILDIKLNPELILITLITRIHCFSPHKYLFSTYFEKGILGNTDINTMGFYIWRAYRTTGVDLFMNGNIGKSRSDSRVRISSIPRVDTECCAQHFLILTSRWWIQSSWIYLCILKGHSILWTKSRFFKLHVS